jgi:hypothetical protein
MDPRRSLAVAIALATLGGCAAGGGAGIGGRPSLEAAAARLPASVAGFARGDAVWHERERPGHGVAVDYAGPARAAVATVSLYDRGQGSVSERDARIAGEFDSAVADVLAQAGARTSSSLAERGRSQMAVPGGAPLDCARLEGTYGRQPVGTLVCVGAAAGRFIKVQVTAPSRQVRPVDPGPFVVGVAQAARGA